MSELELKKVSLLTLFVFILFALFFYVKGYKEDIPIYMEVMRVIITCHYCWLLYCAFNLKMSNALFYMFLFLTFCMISFVFQYSQYYYSGSIFGATGDPYVYTYTAVTGKHFGFVDYCNYVSSVWEGAGIDDLGFYVIMYLIVLPLERNSVEIANVLILWNCIFYVIGVYFFHKLSVMLINDERMSLISTVLWAGLSRLITTAAGGAKEVFFTTFIIIAMYNIYKYKESPCLWRFIVTILTITLSLFFRIAIFYTLILCFILMVLVNEDNKKILLKVSAMVALFSVPIVTFLLPLLTGFTFEHVLTVTNARMEMSGASGIQQQLFPIVSLFFGPFPNFDRIDGKGFTISFSILLKDFLSIYFIHSILNIVKNYDYKYYPLLLFVFCNLLMCIAAGVTLDLRYHLTYIPFFFIILMYPDCRELLNDYVKWAVYLAICFTIFVYSNRQFNPSREEDRVNWSLIK